MATASNPLGAGYPVHLPNFDGPIELLLSLIELQKLDITQVSLVAITDQYLHAIEEIRGIEPEALADFLTVAARLLHIKSRGLLPSLPEGETEEESSESLIQQLLDYRRYRAAVEELQLRAELGLRTSARPAAPPRVDRPLNISSLTLEKLAEAAHRAMQSRPGEPPLPSVRTHPITVADRVTDIRGRINGLRAEHGGAHAALPFSDLLSGSRSRVEIVVTFLAVLELIKRQEITAEQPETFGEIVLRRVA